MKRIKGRRSQADDAVRKILPARRGERAEAVSYTHLTMGHAQDARAWLEKAANHRTGNLDESDFYTGCAMRRLGREQEAAALYRSMLEQADRIPVSYTHLISACTFPPGTARSCTSCLR